MYSEDSANAVCHSSSKRGRWSLLGFRSPGWGKTRVLNALTLEIQYQTTHIYQLLQKIYRRGSFWPSATASKSPRFRSRHSRDSSSGIGNIKIHLIYSFVIVFQCYIRGYMHGTRFFGASSDTKCRSPQVPWQQELFHSLFAANITYYVEGAELRARLPRESWTCRNRSRRWSLSEQEIPVLHFFLHKQSNEKHIELKSHYLPPQYPCWRHHHCRKATRKYPIRSRPSAPHALEKNCHRLRSIWPIGPLKKPLESPELRACPGQNRFGPKPVNRPKSRPKVESPQISWY